jgi:succinoglycan biosynthesis protein ExoA
VILLLSNLAVAFMLPGWWSLGAAIVPAAYASLMVAVAMLVMRRHGVIIGCLFPVAAMTMHVAYGAGFLWGSGKSNKGRSEPQKVEGLGWR